MKRIFNLKTEKKKRKALRRDMPKAEVYLWKHLKGKQLEGYKFRRQYGVGKFVVDFYCPKKKLAIEIDGPSHFLSEEVEEYDKRRQQYIESLGIKFLRFTNTDIYDNVDGVIDDIMDYLCS